MSYRLIKGKGEKEQPGESSCQTALQATELKVALGYLERFFEDHKTETAKNFSSLETKLDRKCEELKKEIEKHAEEIKYNFESRLKELKGEIEKQDEKLESVDEKVQTLKNGLTALFARFGILFSAVCTAGMLFVQYLLDKF